jgi:hypothetical protein
MNKPVIFTSAALTAVVAFGVWYFLRDTSGPAPAPVADLAASAVAPAEPAIAHPVPAEEGQKAQAAPLPLLNDSDPALRDGLADLVGPAAVKTYLEPENIVRRLVVTVDNLARQKLPAQRRPVRALNLPFHAEGDELHATLDPKNYERYAPLIAVVKDLDTQRLVGLYVHFYSLFQNAYQDLGYPTGYFNDRLIEVIDLLLATPQVTEPVELVRPNVMYEFADRSLEERPSGQKLLIRMGPANAAVVKSKLAELRAALTAAPLKK